MSVPGFLYDTNVWLALALESHPLRPAAAAHFVAGASASSPAFWCRATQQSVLRILSTASIMRAYGVVLSNRDALTIMDGFAANPAVGFLGEPENLFAPWRQFADLATPSPKRWMDACLAAFAIGSGVVLVTGDSDFNAFPGLNVVVLTVSPSANAVPSSGGATS